MDNPELYCHTIDTATIYQYDNQTNVPWNLTEYRTPKTEVNAELEIKKRRWTSQKKAQKDGRYVTKRGYYMDYDLKIAKSVPSTHAHGVQKQWDFTEERKKGFSKKVDPKLMKHTYLQKIEIDQKKRKIPGIGVYSLEKSIKQKDEQREKLKKQPLKTGQKIFYHQNTELLSSQVPGVGHYCPRHISPKEKTNKSDYKFWMKKHRLDGETLSKREAIKPAPGTHSPMNTTLFTFDQLALEYRKPSKKKGFGTDAKFEYTRENKKAIIEKRADLLAHAQVFEWKGKSVSPKKILWNQMVSKGPTQTIYH